MTIIHRDASFSSSCTIEEDNEVTIVGGALGDRTRVTNYRLTGASKSLPSLKTGRYQPACGYFTNTLGSKVSHGLYEY